MPPAGMFGLCAPLFAVSQKKLCGNAAEFFTRYDLLLCPAACTPPFDVGTRWLTALDGVAFDNYVEWIRITYAVTLTSCPVIAMPAGFTGSGLPVGLQLIGRPRGEVAVELGPGGEQLGRRGLSSLG